MAESRYPIRFERYALHTEEYGIGKFRGGLGTFRDYRFLTGNVSIQIANEQTVCRSHGLQRGHAGGINRLWAWPDTDKQTILTECGSFYGPFENGDLISCRTAGGGGFEDPLERDPERVRWEVLNEILTPEQADELRGGHHLGRERRSSGGRGGDDRPSRGSAGRAVVEEGIPARAGL